MKFLKISAIFLLIIFLLISFKILKSRSQELSTYKSKCSFDLKKSDILCMDRNNIVFKEACDKMKYLIEVYDKPFFGAYEDVSVVPYYSNNFFKIYKPRELKEKDNCHFYDIFKSISQNIEEKYPTATLNNKSRLMLSELSMIWIYGEDGSKDVKLFKGEEVNADELLCHAEKNGEYVYPVISVIKHEGVAYWIFFLSKGANSKEMLFGNQSEVTLHLKHYFLYYGTLKKKQGQVRMFSEIGLEYKKIDQCNLLFEKSTESRPAKIGYLPDYYEFNDPSLPEDLLETEINT